MRQALAEVVDALLQNTGGHVLLLSVLVHYLQQDLGMDQEVRPELSDSEQNCQSVSSD